MQYRIEWKDHSSGYSSNGDWFTEKDKGLLESYVEYYNKEYNGDIYHWIISM